jgi:ABC-type lipoprotein release transport system permease subunit
MVRYTLYDLKYEPGRTALTITGMAVIVFAYLAVTALSAAMAAYGREAGAGHNLVIVEANLVDPREGQVDLATIETALATTAGAMSGAVRHVSPLTAREMRVNEHVLQLFSAARSDWQSVYELELVAGRRPAASNEAALTEGVTILTGWDVGTALRIYGSDFVVTGVLRAPATMYSSVWLDLAQEEQLFGAGRGYQFVIVQLTPESHIEAIRAELEAHPLVAGRYGVYVQENLSRRYAEALADIRRVTRLVAGIVLLMVVFGAYNATSLSLVERGRDTVVLQALGFPPAAVRGFWLLRAGVLGTLAYLLGLLAAVIFITGQQSRAPLLLRGIPVALHLSPAAVLAAFCLVFALVLAGAWLSTRYLPTANIAEGLRR